MLDYRIAALVLIAIITMILFIRSRFFMKSAAFESTLSLFGRLLRNVTLFVVVLFFIMFGMSTEVPVGDAKAETTSYRLVKMSSGAESDCYLSRLGRKWIRFSCLEEDGSLADNSAPCGDMIICYTYLVG